MPDGVMTTDTGELLAGRRSVRSFNRACDLLMALSARLLSNLAAVRFDLNNVLVPAGCEVERVPEAVRSFRRVLAYKARRSMAIVANSNRTVR